MNINIAPYKVNFSELVKSNNNFSIKVQNKMINKMNETFDDEEQRWYVANFYMYMNYHPTDVFPIDLEDVYSMIGFVNKENSKKTLKNNFIENVDYKIYDDIREENFASPLREAKTKKDKGQTKPAPLVELAGLQELKRNLGGAGQNKQKVMLNVIGEKSLNKAILSEKKYNGFYYKTIPEKLQI